MSTTDYGSQMSKRKREENEEEVKKGAKISKPEETPLRSNPTILERIIFALRTLGVASSAHAIVKAIQEHKTNPYTDTQKVRKAIKSGVNSGKLQTAGNKMKFWIGGESIPEVDAGPQCDIEDIKVGSGPTVAVGDEVAISYKLELTAFPGKKVESAKRFCFQVGAGDVIKGMDRGIADMRLGGVRRVKVPWALGYGKRGSAPDIPPEADLTFHITLLTINDLA